MRSLVRTVLVAMAVIQLIIGTWAALFPSSFYADFPTVDWTPPYSEHLFRDFGGMTLGSALILAAAAYTLHRLLTLLALGSYLVFSIPHLFFHMHHLNSSSPALSAALVASLILTILVPLATLALAARILT
jgi:hypothetical protein